jgi:hypothetical protein
MQTFLPFPDFHDSLLILDNKRLGKQRVEAYQILQILEKGGKWENHPAVLMWKGYEKALLSYLKESIRIWKERGYKDTMSYNSKLQIPVGWITGYDLPPWFGNEYFHMSHRSRLIQKDIIYKSLFKPIPNIPYLWPVSKDNRIYQDNIFYILGEDAKLLKINSIDLNTQDIKSIIKK